MCFFKYTLNEIDNNLFEGILMIIQTWINSLYGFGYKYGLLDYKTVLRYAGGIVDKEPLMTKSVLDGISLRTGISGMEISQLSGPASAITRYSN